MVILFFKYCLIGLAIGAVLGPIGLLFIQKTLEVGIYAAAAIGLGAALADGV